MIREEMAVLKVATTFAAILLGLVAVGTVALFLMIWHSFGGQWACENSGGKWGSVHSECITKSCYRTATCGNWLHPSQWLDRIKAGDTVADVYFWLGEPYTIRGDDYYWADGKGDWSYFKTTIRDGKLVVIDTARLKDIPD